MVNKKEDISVSRQSDYEFASYVAEYALVLENSKHKGISTYDHLLERINNDYIDDKYRDDFVGLVNLSKERITE